MFSSLARGGGVLLWVPCKSLVTYHQGGGKGRKGDRKKRGGVGGGVKQNENQRTYNSGSLF